MLRIKGFLLWLSVVTLVLLSIVILVSTSWSFDVEATKTNTATGLIAIEWKTTLAYGLLFVSRYDATDGAAVSGPYVMDYGETPAQFAWFVEARDYTTDVTPFLSLAWTPNSGSNGVTAVALPLWPAILLTLIVPGISVGTKTLRAWKNGHSGRKSVIVLGSLALAVVGVVLVGAVVLLKIERAAEAREEQFDKFYHELNLFVMFLQCVARDNGGVCPAKTLSEAVDAVERGSAICPGQLAKDHCPNVLKGFDPWGRPIIYDWWNGGRDVSVESLGPPGANRTMKIAFEK
jgi:hypothetical protein